MPRQPDPPEPSEAFPPRFWWFKRLAIAYGIFIVALAVGYASWSAHSKHALASEIEATRARGEPAILADFIPKAIPPDAHNGALPLQAAAAIVKARGLELPRIARDNPWAHPLSERDRLSKLVTENAETLRLVRSARAMKVADWGTRLTARWIDQRLPHLNDQRQLNRFLGIAAAYHHAIGNDAESLEICLDMLHQAKLLAQDTPAVVTIVQARGLAVQ